ncbi:MAG TPA: tetratricopeptide repeat protein [Gemmataceae bacterium]|jgi:predicted O-linked N-acetylglucosamine transferase (SPINDLY family)
MPNRDELYAQSCQCYRRGQTAQAEQLCWDLIRLEPLHPGAIYLLGVLALEAGQAARAILHFHHAATLQPADAALHNALGEAYRSAGRPSEAAGCFHEALRHDPRLTPAHHALGLVLLDQGDPAAAADSFRRTLALRPDHERAHLNLGRALQIQGDLDAAATSYAAALRLRPDYALAHNNLGVVLQAQAKHAAAGTRFREALRCQPDYPEAHFNLGSSLQALGDPAAALPHFREALRLRPDYARAHFGLGRALQALGDMPTALASLRQAVRLDPGYAEAHEALGNLLLLQPDWEGARAAFARALEHQPDNAAAFARLAYTRQVLCDWRTWPADLERLDADTARALDAGLPAPVVPFCALTLPWSAARLLAVARSHSDPIARLALPLRQELALTHPPPADHLPRGGRLRIGYLSGEFRDHAVSHLVQGLFGLHDRSRFEVFAYSFGADDGSSYRRRIARDCDHFRDLAALSVADSARRIHADGIHLLVDLQGYTGFARMGLTALRPAPVQAHYIGYPGSLGADFIDYLIGDPVVTPAESAADFRECLVTLPHAYLATDHQQPIAAAPVTRADCGLPEEGFVFCGFGNRYKIESVVFAVWMRLLAGVPGSVLWLSPAAPAVEQNLRREAEGRGVDGRRLVFARHLPGKAEHLARHRAADLMLDTLYYNAHTTAADALWAGLPLLTCPGQTFASRVGASLLRALGLPELIAADLEDYERRAARLALHPPELTRLRDALAERRTRCPLFDAPRLVRNLERAYGVMWENYAAARPPRPIVIRDEEPEPGA